MSHVLPNISQGRFFEPIFTSKKFDLYMSIYGILPMGGGGGLKDFFGSEILAKRDYFWVYERCRDFLGLHKNQGIF